MTRLMMLIGSVVIIASAGAAQATLVAGWDFSQFRGTGIPSTDGVSNTTTLPANYSGLDPTFNAGSESATHGTATWSGPIVPIAGSLSANLTGPVEGPGDNPFDSRTVLAFEGQTYQQLLGLTTTGPAEIVFGATNGPASGGDWAVFFGGKTLSGTSTVGVDFSTDGVSFTPIGSVLLDTSERTTALVLANNTLTSGYVRMTLDASTGQPVIDNVAIKKVPEPGFVSLLVTGVGALLVLARRRRWPRPVGLLRPAR